MRQARAAKRRPRPASWPQTPLPPDPRDPDIVRAHQISRHAPSPAPGPGWAAGSATFPAARGRPPNPARRTPCIH
jgi:hypothetical protein